MRRRALVTTAVGLWLGVAVAAPPNDACTTATAVVDLPFTASVDVSTATTAPDDPGVGCVPFFEPGARSVWFRFTAPDDLVLDLDTQGSDYDTVLVVHPDACGALDQFTGLACGDDDLALDPQSRVFVAVSQGETILIEVTGFGGTLALHVRHAPEGQPGKSGAEFVVNTHTEGDQGYYFFRRSLSLCAAADGDFVVVWQSDDPTSGGQDGDRTGIFGQRYDGQGGALGGEFQVNQQSTGEQEWPAVACDPTGGFVVAWENGAYSGAEGIRARRFADDGAPLTGDLDVATAAGARDATVGIAPSGSFVVGYDTGNDVLVRRYDGTGTPLGPAFAVSETTGDVVFDPDLGADAAGTVVVWENSTADDIRGRRLDSAGAFVGGEFTVNATGDLNVEPSVSLDPAGGFVVTWVGDDENGDQAVRVRRFDGAGVPGPVIPVNTDLDENVVSSDIAVDPEGNFIVVWEDYALTDGVLGRRFLADGSPVGDVEWKVNTVEPYQQHAPHVAAASPDDFVVAWVGYDGWDEGGSYFAGGYGVRAQRFRVAPAPPCPASPRAGCKQPTTPGKGRLGLRDKTPDAGDALTWKWSKGEATTLTDLGDPTATDSYAVCLYDGAGTLLLQAHLPAGGTCGSAPCWRRVGADGFRYGDRTGARGGIVKLLVDAAGDGAAALSVKGKGTPLAMPALPPALPVRAQLAASTGACWEAEFRASGVVQATSTAFAAKPHAD